MLSFISNLYYGPPTKTSAPYLSYNSNPNQFASVFKPRMSNGPFQIPASKNGKYGVKSGIASLPTWSDYRRPGNMEYDMEASKIMAGFTDEQMKRFQMYMDTQFQPGTRENLEYLKRTIPDWNKPRTEIINCKLELMKRLMFLKITGPSKMEDWLLLFLVEDGELLFPKDIKSLIQPDDPDDKDDLKKVDDWFKKTTKPFSRYTYFTIPLEKNIRFMSNLSMFPFDSEGRQEAFNTENITVLTDIVSRSVRTTGDLTLTTATNLYNAVTRGSRNSAVSRTQRSTINSILDYFIKLQFEQGSDIVNLYGTTPGVLRRAGNFVYGIGEMYLKWVTYAPRLIYDRGFDRYLPSYSKYLLIPVISFTTQILSGLVFESFFSYFGLINAVSSGSVMATYRIFRTEVLLNPLKALFTSDRGYNFYANVIRTYMWMTYNLLIPLEYVFGGTFVNWVIGGFNGTTDIFQIPDFIGNIGAHIIFPQHVIEVAKINTVLSTFLATVINATGGPNMFTNAIQTTWFFFGSQLVEKTNDVYQAATTSSNPIPEILPILGTVDPDLQNYAIGGAMAVVPATMGVLMMNYTYQHSANRVNLWRGIIDEPTYTLRSRTINEENYITNTVIPGMGHVAGTVRNKTTNLARYGYNKSTNLVRYTGDLLTNLGNTIYTNGQDIVYLLPRGDESESITETIRRYFLPVSYDNYMDTYDDEYDNLFFNVNSNLNNISVIYSRINDMVVRDYRSSLADYSNNDPGYIQIENLINPVTQEFSDHISFYVNGITKTISVNLESEIFNNTNKIKMYDTRNNRDITYIQLNQEMLLSLINNFSLSPTEVSYDRNTVNIFNDKYQPETFTYTERFTKTLSNTYSSVYDLSYKGITFFPNLIYEKLPDLSDYDINIS